MIKTKPIIAIYTNKNDDTASRLEHDKRIKTFIEETKHDFTHIILDSDKYKIELLPPQNLG